MEFHEKLQELRKQSGLTQEELAECLYVSRAAISKWESGRGYPNIDSLKAIAKFFSVTIDELLSSNELLGIAEEDHKQQRENFRSLIFGLLDSSTAMFFFLPFFAQRSYGGISEVSLLSLTEIQLWLRTVYFIFVIGIVGFGLLTLALRNRQNVFWEQNQCVISLFIHSVGIILFIISLQPYPAVFLFIFLIIKLFLIVKK
ncbi:MAG: helix-turn-helix transcriptional regulator [Oscillospiraceae bacterium]|nr:helix-turn-helix transcriptional regulator [Oscillospiraceae bacterium]